MYQLILQLLKIKPHETSLVKKLFAVQFLLGVSTAFLFTSSLTTFISVYHINALPQVYIVSAIFLILFNRIYSYLDERLTSPKLLEVVILFSVVSVLIFWIGVSFLPYQWILLLLAGWYLLLYMLINYAFWGMASMLFNVRESRRLFSLVGAGDIPAKMLGYISVTVLVPFIGVNNLLWISIITSFLAWVLVKKYRKDAFLVAEDPNATLHLGNGNGSQGTTKNLISKFFGTRIVFVISIFSFISYIIFAFMDFTFLAGVKYRFTEEGELASFIGIFFASGRILAVFFKLLFSSRLIAAIGLANSLLVTPVLLLIITFLLIVLPDSFASPFYVFGVMVLLSEMLRSTLQEPVFFILFQPLKPHDRLRGHLVAKGHTMPIALLGVGLFLYFFLKSNIEISIFQVSEILIGFMLLWCISVFFIKKEYVKTLIGLLRKGYFTGTSLFLNEESVTQLLLKKTETGNAIEVIHSLSLLEKSGYSGRHQLLLNFLQTDDYQIKTYVLLRIIANNMTSALPIIKLQLDDAGKEIAPQLYQAFFYLNQSKPEELLYEINNLNKENKKAAMIGLLLRRQEETGKLVFEELEKLSGSIDVSERLLALSIIMESGSGSFNPILRNLLNDPNEEVCKKAIEAAASVKDFELLMPIMEIVKRRNLYTTFKTALFYYGDEAFNERYYSKEFLNHQLISAVIKIAGKITGEHSTTLLFKLLKESDNHTDSVVCSLWTKKANILPENRELIDEVIIEILENSGIKLSYYMGIATNKNLLILQEALQKEINSDLTTLLRLYSFIYDTEKMNRIIELITSGNTSRVYNAIEMLELILPVKYFGPTNNLIEWLQDVIANKLVLVKSNKSLHKIMDEIFSVNRGGLHSWTRSIACYALLRLKKDIQLLQSLQRSTFSKDDRLFSETRHYVLSILNK